jgi:hydrogenase-4 component E
VQSLALTLALVAISASAGTPGLFGAALLTFLVKAVIAPVFLFRLVRKYEAHFSAASYLNTPLTLLVLMSITLFAYVLISPALGGGNIALLFASVFGTLFLMINRRGALAAVVGVLALENGIVLLAGALGVEHSFALEFAIAFDIAVWIAVAGGFLGMMYRQFGTIDDAALSMTRLTED